MAKGKIAKGGKGKPSDVQGGYKIPRGSTAPKANAGYGPPPTPKGSKAKAPKSA